MDDSVVESLLLDLLEWLAQRDRSYDEVMAAWRTSCPRLPVWEEANDRALVLQQEVNGRSIVTDHTRGPSAAPHSAETRPQQFSQPLTPVCRREGRPLAVT